MFFTLAWGLGTPLLVLGTVSGSISRLPRSGDWMVWVRKVFGFILIAMGLYFARHLLGDRVTAYGYVATAFIAGIYLGWLDRTPVRAAGFARLKMIAGVLGVAIAALLLLAPGGALRSTAPVPGIAWEPFTEERLAAAILGRLVHPLPRARSQDILRCKGHRALRTRGIPHGGPDPSGRL
jgi:thiol:disulfide interchange protein DsbD